MNHTHQTKTAHTPEPWFVYGCRVQTGDPKDLSCGRVICDMTYRAHGDSDRADARRIVACVNACVSLPDPAVVPELVDALKQCVEAIADYRADLGHRGCGYAGDQARAILARCGKATP